MRNYVVSGLLLISLIHSTSGAAIPIFSDDFESGTMANWTTTGTNPLDPFTPSNAVPAGGRWSAMMNVTTDRMHRNIIADNGGSEATGHLMFSFWIYDDGNTGAIGANRVFNELRGHSGGTG